MIIAFDVTDRVASLSWMRGDGSRGREIKSGRATEFLLPLIECVVAKGGESLTAIGVILGPGSFTGIRVGLATALGLAAAQKLKVHGFTKIELMDPGPGSHRLLFPAGRGAVALVAIENGKPVSAPNIVAAESVVPEPGDYSLGTLPGIVARVWDHPLTDLAIEAMQRGEGEGNTTPFYLRPPDAVAGRSLIDTLLNRENDHAGHENNL